MVRLVRVLTFLLAALLLASPKKAEARVVDDYPCQYNLPLLQAIELLETHCNRNAVSPAGAVCSLQVMPREAGFPSRPTAYELATNPELCQRWATVILEQNGVRHTPYRSLVRYNGGGAFSREYASRVLGLAVWLQLSPAPQKIPSTTTPTFGVLHPKGVSPIVAPFDGEAVCYSRRSIVVRTRTHLLPPRDQKRIRMLPDYAPPVLVVFSFVGVYPFKCGTVKKGEWIALAVEDVKVRLTVGDGIAMPLPPFGWAGEVEVAHE